MIWFLLKNIGRFIFNCIHVNARDRVFFIQVVAESFQNYQNSIKLYNTARSVSLVTYLSKHTFRQIMVP